MTTKILEVRDKGTFVPVMAIHGDSQSVPEGASYLLRRAGWVESEFTYMVLLEDGRCQWDAFQWGDRTFRTAHIFIEHNWHLLQDGDVVDVQFILGETSEKKVSEREEVRA